MVGCYGNSKEDKHFSNMLDNHLETLEQSYTGHFIYEFEIDLLDGRFLYVEVEGDIEDDSLVDFSYSNGYISNENAETVDVTKVEIDKLVNMDNLVESEINCIIDWTINLL